MIKRQGVCLISYGETPFVRPKGEDKPALQYLADAMKQALDRVHLGKTDIGGFAFSSTTLGDEAEPVAEQLGLELDWVLRADYGGSSGIIGLRRAADAIQLGQIEIAVCAAADNLQRARLHNAIASYQKEVYIDYPIYPGPSSWFAMIQRRHMAQYGTTLEQLGKIALAIRYNARLNEHALLRGSLTMQDYLEARLIMDPIRLYDCVMPCSGGAAVVLTSERMAKELMAEPIYLVSDAEKIAYRCQDMVADRTTSGLAAVAGQLFSEVKREEIDLAELYDDFTMAVLLALEDLGFCAKGKGGGFVDTHDFTVHGNFPINTGGGMLSGGQPSIAGGYALVAEAVRQLRGEAGAHQVKGARTALVSGFGGGHGYNATIGTCAAMILQRRTP